MLCDTMKKGGDLMLLIGIKVIQYVFWGFLIHAYTIYRQSI